MKRLISFSLFVVIVLMFGALRTAQAQVVVVRPVAPRVVIAGPPVYRGPRWGVRGFRRAPMMRPVPMAFVRPRFYPRPFVRVRARVW